MEPILRGIVNMYIKIRESVVFFSQILLHAFDFCLKFSTKISANLVIVIIIREILNKIEN